MYSVIHIISECGASSTECGKISMSLTKYLKVRVSYESSHLHIIYEAFFLSETIWIAFQGPADLT